MFILPYIKKAIKMTLLFDTAKIPTMKTKMDWFSYE